MFISINQSESRLIRVLYRKNNFEILKNLARDTYLKIILLNYKNNYVL